jgi:AAT family amino acid transporter
VGVINFVVLTAAASSCNSGIFSTGRMSLPCPAKGRPRARWAEWATRGVPANPLHVSFVVLLIGVVLNYFVPEKAFTYVTSIATVGALWVWGVIMVAHLRYRRAVRSGSVSASPFRMPGSPYTNYFVLTFLVLVFVLLGFDAGNRIALYVALPYAALGAIGCAVTRSRTTSFASEAATNPPVRISADV